MIDIEYRGGPANGRRHAILPDPDGVPPLTASGFVDCFDHVGCDMNPDDWPDYQHRYVYERATTLPESGPVVYEYDGRTPAPTPQCLVGLERDRADPTTYRHYRAQLAAAGQAATDDP